MRLSRRLKEYSAGTWTLLSVGTVLLLPLFLLIGIAFKAIPIFDHVSLGDMLFSSVWQPSSGKFGFFPFIFSSLVVTAIGLVLMIPFGLLPAIYLTQYAPPGTLKVMRSVIDILAGIPSVIHGVWGV